jgi:hypothetical protein
MNFRNKMSAIMLGLAAPLFLSVPVEAEPIQSSDNTSVQQAILSPFGPEQSQLTEVSLSPLVVSGETVGMVVVYDDPTTERPVDFLALYDNAGQLVAIGWFDKFGIQRMAMDRGLLEDNGKLEGVLVLVLDGDLA